MTKTIVLPLSSGDRWLAGAFLGAAFLAGVVAFTAGRGLYELATAPRYQPTLPSAPEVSADVRRERLRWLAQRVPLAGVLQADAAHALTSAARPPLADLPPVETTERGNWIRVPALSLNLPLATARTLETPEVLRALQIGVVRYPNGVALGQPGVVVVAGHSTGEPWKGRYRFAFLNARKLQPGDAIHVDHAGVRYTYRVSGQRLIRPREMPFLESSATHSQLTLVTCWPLWTTQQRLLVDAELVSTARLVYRSPRGQRS